MRSNFNIKNSNTNFGMAIRLNDEASRYFQVSASKRRLAQLHELMKAEEGKPDILLSRTADLFVSGPGQLDRGPSYWKAESVDNKDLFATARWFNAPIRVVKKFIKRRELTEQFLNNK